MFIRQTNLHYMVPMFEQLGQSYTEMILPPQHSCKLVAACMHACSEYLKPTLYFNLASYIVKTYSPVQLTTNYLICYSKTILKVQATIHPTKTHLLGIFSYKQVLNFEKLNAEEKKPETENQTKIRKSVNKQKFQKEVVITAITFYFTFSYQLQQCFAQSEEKQITVIISKTYLYVLEISQGSTQSN